MDVLIIILILIGLATATIGILYYVGVLPRDKKKTSNPPSLDNSDNKTCKDNYITPKPFKTGFVNDPRHKNANVCSKKPFGYAIQQPYVNYGLPKIPDNCACTEFIQPP